MTYTEVRTVFSKKVYADFGIKFHFTSVHDPENISRLITENTRLIWIETPTNPLLNIIDIKAVADLVANKDILVGVDNTFATPYLQTPLDLGADIVMHSATKYLGGHSDVVMGALVCNSKDLADDLIFLQNASGAVPGPQDCFLVLRGVKTLHVRMQRHCENAEVIAKFLKDHPKVDQIYYPGFETHFNHDIALKQMKDFGGMVSFTLREDRIENVFNVLEKFKVFSLAESLGGVESLCGHPATMTHASISKEERDKRGLKDSMIRLSVGIEDIEDLVEDIDQALS